MGDRLRELTRCVGRGNSGFATRDMSERHWQHLKSCTCDDDPYGEACGFCLCERGNSGFYSDKEILELLNTRATDPLFDITGFAHELWALAQLMPEEGILDGVMRIEEALQKYLSRRNNALQST